MQEYSGDVMADFREKFKKSGQEEMFGLEEALAKINIELLNPTGNKLYTVSDVTAKEIYPLVYLLSVAKKFKSKVIENWINHFLLMRISRFRLGRREFVFISGGMREVSEARGGKG